MADGERERTDERFESESRRVDPEAFDELVARVRTDGHALIDTVVGQWRMADDRRGEVIRRYPSDAHDALDTVLNLARLTPDVANGLATGRENAGDLWRSARDFAGAARRETERALGPAADTDDGRFLLDLTEYVVERNR